MKLDVYLQLTTKDTLMSTRLLEVPACLSATRLLQVPGCLFDAHLLEASGFLSNSITRDSG